MTDINNIIKSLVDTDNYDLYEKYEKRFVIYPRMDDNKLLNINKKQHEKLKVYLKSNKFKKTKEEIKKYYFRDIVISENEKYEVKNYKLETKYMSFIEFKNKIYDFDFPYIKKYDHEEDILLTKYDLGNYSFEFITCNDKKIFKIVFELNDDLSFKSDNFKDIQKIFNL
jgi:hypothetical protein